MCHGHCHQSSILILEADDDSTHYTTSGNADWCLASSYDDDTDDHGDCFNEGDGCDEDGGHNGDHDDNAGDDF